MNTVEFRVGDRAEAAQHCADFDCPAIATFVSDWEQFGSVRFIGLNVNDEEVSVLLVAAGRPESALPARG